MKLSDEPIARLGRPYGVTLASDMVFSDGASLELATMTGTVAGGLTAALTVAV